MNLTPSEIRYLLAIYALSDGGTPVRSVDVSRELAVTRASVAKTLKQLSLEGMIEKEHYGDIVLTPLGIKTANRLYTQTTVLRHFLRHHLGVDSDTALRDAVACVTVLSEDSLQQLSVLPLPESAEN